MKKKIASVLLLIVLCFVALPVANAAKETIEGAANTIYGTISRERTDEGGAGIETNNIYITKSSSEYIYLTFTPGLNVKEISSITPTSGFKMVSSKKTSNDGSWTVLLKSNNGKVTKETQILELMLEQEKVGEDCNVVVTPIPLSCSTADGKYFIADGSEVTKEVYDSVCSNVTPTTPTPDEGDDVQTGIPVPYLAVAGGVLAIAGVYLYSRKQNKMYKI